MAKTQQGDNIFIGDKFKGATASTTFTTQVANAREEVLNSLDISPATNRGYAIDQVRGFDLNVKRASEKYGVSEKKIKRILKGTL